MEMLEDCIDKIFEKAELSNNDKDKELYKSIYYHLLDYKDVMSKVIELNNELEQVSNRWALVKKANDNK